MYFPRATPELETDCGSALLCDPTRSTAPTTPRAATEIIMLRFICLIFDLNASLALCRTENGVILRKDHVLCRIPKVALRATRESLLRRLLFKRVRVSELKKAPPFGLF